MSNPKRFQKIKTNVTGKRRKPFQSAGSPGREQQRPAEQVTARRATRGWGAWLLLLGLLLATLAAYHPAWRGRMLWDDDRHITRSDLRPAEGLWRIWFDLGATQQYYPVTHSAFWLLHRLWGDAMLGYHLVNIILHALAAFLVAVILRRLGVPGAWLAAVIFALHPIQVESVAWISELKNTLSGVLYLVAVLAYLHFDKTRQKRIYALALALFVLALLSKTVTATLPAALLVIFWWQRGHLSGRRDVAPLMPWFVIGAAGGLLTALVERTLIGAQGAEFQFTLIERGLIAGRVVCFYLGKLFWPANLTFIYPRWQISQGVWWQYLYPLVVAVLLAALWRMRSRAPLAAMLFFCGTLFPALGFFNVYPFRYSFVADHFQYLASIGIIALFTAGLASLLRRWSFQPKPAAAVMTVVLGGALAFPTWSQSRQYANAETLYRVTISRNPSCWMAYNNLGNALQARGQVEKALAQYQEALRLKPDYAEAHNNLGDALQGLGRLDEAITQYQAALRLKPDFGGAYYNLGNALQGQGRLEEAAAQYREALRHEPGSAEAQGNLGSALQGLGRLDEAVIHLREAVKLKPDYATAYNNLGSALQQMGRLDEAAAQHMEAVRLKPDFAEAYNCLGSALQRMGRVNEAVTRYREALRLKPDYAEAHNNLGNALLALGRQSDAIKEYNEALRLKPDIAGVYFNLGNALQALGRHEEAVTQYNAALRLKPDFTGARYNLGQVLQGLGRLDEAALQYREVLKAEPGSAEAHNNLGVALAGRGRLEEAATHFREALRIKPDFSDARANLSRALTLLGKLHGPSGR